MEVRIYKDEALVQEAPVVLPDAEQLEIESTIAHHRKMAEMADEAGLKWQASNHRQRAKAAETKLLPPPPFPELTPTQITVWKKFLPTAYSGREGLSRYNYDLAPPQVLEIIGQYRDSFTELQIRTAEKMKDPALFGIRNFGDQTATYLLARWGESQLISFDDIKKEIMKTVDTSFYGLFTAAALSAILGGIIMLFGNGSESAVLLFLLAICLGFFGLISLDNYREAKAEIAAA